MLDQSRYVASQDGPLVTPLPLPLSQDLEGFSNAYFPYRKKSRESPKLRYSTLQKKELPGFSR